MNAGTFGYYRVQYSPEVLANFIPAIESKQMPPLDRLGLLDDLFALVQSGQASTASVRSFNNKLSLSGTLSFINIRVAQITT